MKFSNFMNSLLTNLIPPKNLKLSKFSGLKFMFIKPYLSHYVMDSTDEGSKVTLDCH